MQSLLFLHHKGVHIDTLYGQCGKKMKPLLQNEAIPMQTQIRHRKNALHVEQEAAFNEHIVWTGRGCNSEVHRAMFHCQHDLKQTQKH